MSLTAIALTMALYCPGYLRHGEKVYHRKAASKHVSPGVMRLWLVHLSPLWSSSGQKGQGCSESIVVGEAGLSLDSEMSTSLLMRRGERLWFSRLSLRLQPACAKEDTCWGADRGLLAETEDAGELRTFKREVNACAWLWTHETSYKHGKLFWALVRGF